MNLIRKKRKNSITWKAFTKLLIIIGILVLFLISSVEAAQPQTFGETLNPPQLCFERKNFADPLVKEAGEKIVEYRVHNLGEVAASNILLRVRIINPDNSNSTLYVGIDEIQPSSWKDLNFTLNVFTEGTYTLKIFDNASDELFEDFKIVCHNPYGENLLYDYTRIEQYEEMSYDFDVSKVYEKLKVSWRANYNGDVIGLKLVSPNNEIYNWGYSQYNSPRDEYIDFPQLGTWKVYLYCAQGSYYNWYYNYYYTYASVRINGISEEPDPLPAVYIPSQYWYYKIGTENNSEAHLVITTNINNSFTKDVYNGNVMLYIPNEYCSVNSTCEYITKVPHNPEFYVKTWDPQLLKGGAIPVTIAFSDTFGNYYNRTAVVYVHDCNFDWNPWNDLDSEYGQNITDKELLETINYWINGKTAPETGAKITDELLNESLNQWACE